MYSIKKILLGAAAVGLVMSSAHSVNAADQDVDASLQTRQALSLSKTSDMDFGIVDYDATNSGTIRLGTNGNVSLNASTGLNLSGGTTTAGSIVVGGDGSSVVEVSCSVGGVLSDGAGNLLTLQNTEFTIDTTAPFSGGTGCAGLGTTPTSVSLSVNPAPVVYLGGEIDTGTGIVNSATYSTTNPGGSAATVRVVYQ